MDETEPLCQHKIDDGGDVRSREDGAGQVTVWCQLCGLSGDVIIDVKEVQWD